VRLDQGRVRIALVRQVFLGNIVAFVEGTQVQICRLERRVAEELCQGAVESVSATLSAPSLP
jgi:hypothetical protein